MTASTTSPEPRFDICIRGSGAVGRALALALSSQGWRVAIVGAQRPRLAPGGATAATDLRAYALNARSVALLQQLKVWDAVQRADAARVVEMRVFGDASGHLEFSAWEQHETELAWIVDAQSLEDTLGDALRYAPHVSQLDQAPGDAEVALTAICEGARSSTRDALGAGVERFEYGHLAIATRLIADRPHNGVAWQWFRSPDILALLPFNRPQPAQSYGLVWSLPRAESERLLALDDAAFEDALNQATGGAAGRLRLGAERASWPMRLMRVSQWTGPGWVLLGDAAHQVHPLAGQGLNLGLADVAALARILGAVRQNEPWRSPADERVLRRYARERAWPTAAMAGVTDGLLHLFAHQSLASRELRNKGLTLLQHLPFIKKRLIGQAMDA
ncbi:FAD-dependent monooxygenase [Aquabacterium sp.]|uniref:FAD-dependent monooxygenase n=1 Tax=Aquabacterium sp. TaxID=1872578 RepID=UPI0035AF2358